MKIKLLALRAVYLDAMAIAESGKLGMDTDPKIRALARLAKNDLESAVVDKPSKTTMSDFLDASRLVAKQIELYREQAWIESNEEPSTAQKLLNSKILNDKAVKDLNDKDEIYWSLEVNFTKEPVAIPVSFVRNLHESINRKTEGYIFDFSILFPSAISVEFRGRHFEVSPYSALQRLIELGLISLT